MKKIIMSLTAFLMAINVFSSSSSEYQIIQLPVQNVTDSCAYIYWDSALKGDSKVTDYAVCLNGVRQNKTARQKSAESNVTNTAYRTAFYDYYTKKRTGLEMIKTDVTFYSLDGLEPDTQYTADVYTIKKNKVSSDVWTRITFRTKSAGKTINVCDYGAVSSKKIISCSDKNEKSLIESNTRAIQKAIDDCQVNGTVYIPNGIYMCGGLNLKSNMTLKIDGVLCGSPYAEHYEFGFLMYSYYTDKRYFGLINANGAENITITGTGTVDGNGWFFADKNNDPSDVYQVYSEEGDVDFSKTKVSARKLIRYAKGNNKKVYQNGILARSCALSFLASRGLTPETAEKSDLAEAYSSRSTTVILRNVKGLLISELLFVNPANHMINILDSKNITVTGITELTYDCNNGDGVGIINSTSALIFNNFIDTGDDSIVFGAGVGKSALTSGQSHAGQTEIFGNYIHHGHGGVAMGSHTALGIYDINIHDNIFNHTDNPFRIKSAPANGGEVYNILFENNAIAYAIMPFTLRTDYSDAGTVSKYGSADKPAVFHDIICRNCTVYKVSESTFYVIGTKGNEHSAITFENIKITGEGMARKNIYCAEVIFK